MRRGSAIKYLKERNAWCAAHPEMIEGVPSMQQDVDDAGREKLDALEAALMSANLIGGNRMIRRETIRRMVGELRDKTFATVPW